MVNITEFVAQIQTILGEWLRNVDPFWVSLIAGALTLLVFARHRLTVPLPPRNNESSDSNVFIFSLPPTEIRVARYAVAAWIVHFLVLFSILTLISFLLAFVYNEISDPFVGARPEKIPQVAKILNDIPNDGLSIFLDFLDRPSAITPHPWQPFVIALAMCGIVPSLKWPESLEIRSRRWALTLVGIPGAVTRLATGLIATDIPDPDTSLSAEDQLFLASTQRHLVSVGIEDAPKAIESIRKVLCFEAWTKEWPDKEIKLRASKKSDRQLEDEIASFRRELNFLNLVSSIRAKSAEATGAGFREQAGFFGHSHVTAEQTTVEKENFDEVLKEHWKLLYARVNSKESEYSDLRAAVCLWLAFFAESSRSLTKAPEACQNWLASARKDRSETLGVRWLFVLLPVLSSVLSWISFQYVPSFAALGSIDLSIEQQSALFSLNAFALIMPAVLALRSVRQTLLEQGKWLIKLGSSYFLLLLSALLFGMVGQALYLIVEPTLRGDEDFIVANALKGQLYPMLTRCIAPTILAITISLFLDSIIKWGRVSFFTISGAVATAVGFYISTALLHKSGCGRRSPFPGRTYPTGSVTGMPRAV